MSLIFLDHKDEIEDLIAVRYKDFNEEERIVKYLEIKQRFISIVEQALNQMSHGISILHIPAKLIQHEELSALESVFKNQFSLSVKSEISFSYSGGWNGHYYTNGYSLSFGLENVPLKRNACEPYATNRRNNQGIDLRLCTEDQPEKKIPVHRAFLIKECSYFKHLLQSAMKEGNQQEVVLNLKEIGGSYESLLSVINYLYTGEVLLDEMSLEKITEIQFVAQLLMLESLSELCRIELYKKLTPFNKAQILSLFQCIE